MVRAITYPKPSILVHGLILLVAILIQLIAFEANAASRFAVFDGSAAASDDLSSFTKWTRVVRSSQPVGDAWNQLIRQSNTGNSLTALKVVNDQVNQYRYIEDKVGWKRQDYWATPQQFFAKGGGDCEDYAIVKYMALRALGWNPKHMRIVVLQDHKLNQLHSVLAVYVQGSVHILDNQLSYLASARDVAHYTPIYSINEQSWWRHQNS